MCQECRGETDSIVSNIRVVCGLDEGDLVEIWGKEPDRNELNKEWEVRK